MFEPNLMYAELQQTYSELTLHGVFKRHKLYGSRVGSCFCIRQYFQEGASSISKVSTTKWKTGRKCSKSVRLWWLLVSGCLAPHIRLYVQKLDLTNWCQSLGFLWGDCCALCSFSPAHERWLDHHSSAWHPPWQSWNQGGDFGVHPLETYLSLLTQQHTVQVSVNTHGRAGS